MSKASALEIRQGQGNWEYEKVVIRPRAVRAGLTTKVRKSWVVIWGGSFPSEEQAH